MNFVQSFDAEYLIKIQQLLSKLEHQDDQIAELKVKEAFIAL